MSRITKSDIGTAANTATLDEAFAGRYRRSVRLSLPTGGAERAEVDGTPNLAVRFLTQTRDALAPGSLDTVNFEDTNHGLALTLPVARRIFRIKLKSPVAGDYIEAFRFDGEAVSEDPVSKAKHFSPGAKIDVTDSQIILKRRNGGLHDLEDTDIESVLIRYAPVNPRLSLLLGANEFALPPPIDAEGLPTFPKLGPRGDDLKTAATALLASLPAPLPDPLEIDLVLAADLPCAARIDVLDFGVVLEKRGFSDKAVLRYAGPATRTDSLALDLPGSATLVSADLAVSVSGAPPAAAARTTAGADLPQTTGEGVPIVADRPVATRLSLDAATVVAAADVVLAAPSGPAGLVAILHGDAEGRPGAPMAESKVSLSTSAAPTALRFAFAPTALPSGPIWLALIAQEGTAIGLLGGNGAGEVGSGTAFLARDTGSRGLAAVLRPVSQAPANEAGGPVIRIGSTHLDGVPASGRAQIDLASALPALQGLTTAELTIESAARATVTLDPPRLRYTL